MYAGYLTFGENLVINNELTRGYAYGRDCPMTWYQAPYCSTMNEALEEEYPYETYPPSDVPWYDTKLANLSERFLGVYGLDFSLVLDSTRQVPTVEGITDGGVIGRTRKGMKRFRLRAILVGEGLDALNYGMSWLNAVIDPDACGQVSSKCGTADVEWFAACPPARQTDPPVSDDEYRAEVDEMRRFLRTCAAESGAIITSEFRSGNFYGYEVEVDFVSETPHILGVSHTVPLDPASPSVIQDIVYNLVQTPSAERPGGTLVVQTNYSTNPSLETNATGWSVSSSVITPSPTGVRSNPATDPAAVGQYSYKVATTTSNSGSTGRISAYQDVPLPAYVAGQRFSFSMWGFMAVVSGTASLTGTRFVLEWKDSGGTTVQTVTIGTGPASGAAISGPNLVRPATATQARCIMHGDAASWSVGAVINLFVDALVVSLP